MKMSERYFKRVLVAFLCCLAIANQAFAEKTASSISSSVSFDKTEIQPNGVARVTVTFTNSNSNQFNQGVSVAQFWSKTALAKTLTNTSTTISFGGLSVASSANLQKSGCDDPSDDFVIQKATISSASGSITVSGIYIAANGSCSIAINLTSGTVGSYSVSVGAEALKGRIGNEEEVSNTASNSAALRVASPVTSRISLSTTSVDFGLGAIGVPVVPAAAINISSIGDIAASLSSIDVSGPNASDFNASSDCPSSLAVGSQCKVSISFTPGGAGTRSAVLSISSDAGAARVSLAGRGSSAVLSGALEVQPATVAVGASASLTFKLANPESLPATGSWTITYPEGLVNSAVPSFSTTCSSGGWGAVPGGNSVSLFGFTIPGKSDCTSSVSIKSSAAGNYEVTVSPADVSASVGGSPAVMGAGVRALLESKAVVFGPTVSKLFAPGSVVAGTNAILTVSLSNPNALPMTGLGFTDTFPTGLASNGAASNDCGGTASGGGGLSLSGGTIQANGGCQVSIPVSAITAGSYTNSIGVGAVTGLVGSSPNPAVVSNLAGASAVLEVTPAPAPGVAFSPGSLDFGAVTINSVSGALRATITNSGTTPLVFSGAFGTSAQFGHVSNCPASLAPTLGCTVDITFAPTAVGPASGTLTVTSNSPGSPHSLPLSGTGDPLPVPGVSFSPASLGFAGQTVATTSSPQGLTLANSGKEPLAISGIGTGGDFAQSNNCPATLLPGASCPISVTFTPLIAGTRTGSLTVASNAPGSPHAAGLTGLGVAIPAPTVSVLPSALAFPGTQLGTVSGTLLVQVRNTGNAQLVVSTVDIIGAGFTLTSNSCNVPVAAGGECAVGVVFAPPALGAASATLRITGNTPGGPTYVGLTGSGIPVPVATLTADPGALAFAERVLGTTSEVQTVAIGNTGTASAALGGLGISGDFAATTTCGSSLAVGVGCAVSVTFTPTAVGARSGTLAILDGSANPLVTVALSGRGAPLPVPVIEVSATSITFGNTTMPGASPPQSFTVRNAGGSPLAITSLAMTGDFVATGCGAPLAAGADCRVDVTFVPHVPGLRPGALSILSNAANGTPVVSLAGTGCRLNFRTFALVCQ